MFTCDQGQVFVMFRRGNIGWDVGQAGLEKLRRDAADPARPSRNMRRQLGSKRHLARASNAYLPHAFIQALSADQGHHRVKVKNRNHPAMEREL